MTDVFISYARKDRTAAEQLAEELRKRNISVWADTQISPGEDWGEAIRSELTKAKKVVVLWTENAARSHTVMHEAVLAEQLKKLAIATLGGDRPPIDLVHAQRMSGDPNSLGELANTIAATLELSLSPASERSLAPSSPSNRGFAFISYAEEDFLFADELRAFLTQEKFLYWEYSSSDRDVEKLLYLELEAKIRESDVVISVISPDWKRSSWAAREYFFAKEIGRPVFIAECRETEPTLALAGEHRMRFWGERRAAGFELLSRELKRRGL